jgi:hypothetical protein
MPKPIARSFRMSDGLLLMLATGVGLLVASDALGRNRYWIEEAWEGLQSPDAGWDGLWELREYGYRIFRPILLAWTAAIVVLRLRRPRPSRRRLWRQPGFVACFAVTFALAFWWAGLAVPIVLATAGELSQATEPDRFREWIEYPAWAWDQHQTEAFDPALAIGVACLASRAVGRPRPEPSWIDRAGRLMGAIWLGEYLIWQWIGLYLG